MNQTSFAAVVSSNHDGEIGQADRKSATDLNSAVTG
jgi:hypothetical protein